MSMLCIVGVTSGDRSRWLILHSSSSARMRDRCERFFMKMRWIVMAVFVVVAASAVGRAQNFKTEKFDIKGDGGTDYVAVEAATGRVFVSRGTHIMVVDGATGKVVGDIPDTPGVHGAGIATK